MSHVFHVYTERGARDWHRRYYAECECGWISAYYGTEAATAVQIALAHAPGAVQFVPYE